MADDLDLSLIFHFEEELGSVLRHCRSASRKLKQLTSSTVELNLKNQLEVIYNENDIDLSVKNILDNVQNIQKKIDTIESTVDSSDKTAFNLSETVEEFENIVKTVLKNKNTIFSHRNFM